MSKNGFTLMELMFVVAVISVLATVAVPNYRQYLGQAKLADAVLFAHQGRAAVADFYAHTGRFPADNRAAGLPEPAALSTARIAALTVDHGALHLHMRADWQAGEPSAWLTLRPLIRTATGAIPLHLGWVCGHGTIPDGFVPVGENRTQFGPGASMLPRECRP